MNAGRTDAAFAAPIFQNQTSRYNTAILVGGGFRFCLFLSAKKIFQAAPERKFRRGCGDAAARARGADAIRALLSIRLSRL
ncbi:MAG: hypothetical protein DBX55_10650 [Verrucomicrobia bacterium]|nr:MAG: hypothetical protein DBX55_10650 [Verrucomicrobiota bacterium]